MAEAKILIAQVGLGWDIEISRAVGVVPERRRRLEGWVSSVA